MPGAGNGIIAPGVQYSLTGGTAFANQGLIMIFHPHYEGVTMHWQEDINIQYTGKPMVIDYCKKTGHCFWGVPIKAPEGATKPRRSMAAPRVQKQSQATKKLSIVERLMLLKSPTISSNILAQATKVAHNVYRLPSIKQGIRWMYAACSYPVKLTWIKAI